MNEAFLKDLNILAITVPTAPDFSMALLALPKDLKSENLATLRTFARQVGVDAHCSPDWCAITGAIPWWRSESVLSTQSVISMTSQDLRTFLTMNQTAFLTDLSESGTFYVDIYGNYFLYATPWVDETGTHTVKWWKICGKSTNKDGLGILALLFLTTSWRSKAPDDSYRTLDATTLATAGVTLFAQNRPPGPIQTDAP